MAHVTPAPPPRADAPRAVELRWLLLGFANAVGPGLALWAWRRPDRKAALLDNMLEAGTSPWTALWWAAGSAVLVGVLYVWVALRQRDGQERRCALRRLTALLAPLAATIIIPLLYVPDIERARRPLICTLTLVCAAALALSVTHAWPWLRERKLLQRLAVSTRAPTLTLAALLLGAAAMLIRLALLRHHALGSQIFDLGIFDNLLWHAAHGHWQTTTVLRGETFTSAHCAPILQLLAPIYMIAPGPETLIVLQVGWLVSGAVPVYLLAVHAFGEWPARRWLGVVFALMWLCHPSLHGVALFDFHALTLAAPMIIWAVYALETGRPKLWIGMIAALLLTREDLPFVVIGLGLYALAAGRRRWAALTIVAALASLAIVKLALMQHADIFMPNAEGSYRYANRFSKVIPDPETGGALDIVATVLSNPAFVIQHAITPGKMIFMAMLALPSLALFVLGGRVVWALSFGLVFTVLGSGSNLANPYLHYTVFSFPGMAAAAVFGLRNLVERVDVSRRAAVLAGLAAALTCASLLAGDRFGALGRSRAFMAGDTPLVRKLDEPARERYAWVRQVAASIPAEASVSATNSLGPHVSSRANLYYFHERPDADYLLLNLGETTRDERRTLRARVIREEIERIDQYGKELVLYRRR